MDFLSFRDPVSAWTHGLWMVLAIPATILLWQRSRGNRTKQLSLLVFGLSLIFCLGGSLLFHAVTVPSLIKPFELIDHIGIYLLIAGTDTPPAAVLLRGRWRWSVLVAIWSMAGLGIILRLFAPDIPTTLSTILYLTMGWAGVVLYLKLATIIPHRDLSPVVVGGVLYTIGALINMAHWPTLVPDLVGPHEIMHLFVMAASLVYFLFMLNFIVPYQYRVPSAVRPARATKQPPVRTAV